MVVVFEISKLLKIAMIIQEKKMFYTLQEKKAFNIKLRLYLRNFIKESF